MRPTRTNDVRALILDDAAAELVRACQESGFELVRVKTVSEGRALLARHDFTLVDGRISRPRPLDEEIQHRLDLFFERLQDHSALRLYETVMRQVEKPLLSKAFGRARGVYASAAKELGIDRGTLARRLRALGILR